MRKTADTSRKSKNPPYDRRYNWSKAMVNKNVKQG